MTDSSGSRRHPSNRGSIGGHFDAVPVPPDGYVPGEFVAYRTLDPVRAAALTAAVELISTVDLTELRTDDDVPGLAVLWAHQFEQYLTGEEADDPTHH